MNKSLLSKWGLGLTSVAAFVGFIGAVNQFDQSKSEGQSQSALTEGPLMDQTQPSVDAVKEEWLKSSSNPNMDIIQYQREPREYKEEYEHEDEDRHDDDDDDEKREYSKVNPSVLAPSYTGYQQQVQVVRRTRAS